MPNKPTTITPVTITPVTITIDGLEVDALIGLYTHEATQPQPLRICLRADYVPNGTKDILCYEDVAQNLCAIARNGHTRLLEELAEKMAQQLLRDQRIKTLWLRLEKPQALQKLARKPNAAPLVSVEITRRQHQKPNAQ